MSCRRARDRASTRGASSTPLSARASAFAWGNCSPAGEARASGFRACPANACRETCDSGFRAFSANACRATCASGFRGTVVAISQPKTAVHYIVLGVAYGHNGSPRRRSHGFIGTWGSLLRIRGTNSARGCPCPRAGVGGQRSPEGESADTSERAEGRAGTDPRSGLVAQRTSGRGAGSLEGNGQPRATHDVDPSALHSPCRTGLACGCRTARQAANGRT